MRAGAFINYCFKVFIMSKTYEYVVLVDDKPLYRGKNLEKLYNEAKKKYPGKKISVKWEPPEGILIAAEIF